MRLARLRHHCAGVDSAPASIDYARARTRRKNLSIDYILADIRRMRVAGPFDLAIPIFGELHDLRGGRWNRGFFPSHRICCRGENIRDDRDGDHNDAVFRC
ncbi:MAG: class I SAM-dependent methyltransferase [Xanthomonadaceae bacterium]|jgi:hypothetical protein|nr:class I SAM-dependent methyltransferase [Xanthomonadaceae bacterium]